jgi:hypothetical protein
VGIWQTYGVLTHVHKGGGQVKQIRPGRCVGHWHAYLCWGGVKQARPCLVCGRCRARRKGGLRGSPAGDPAVLQHMAAATTPGSMQGGGWATCMHVACWGSRRGDDGYSWRVESMNSCTLDEFTPAVQPGQRVCITVTCCSQNTNIGVSITHLCRWAGVPQ